MIGWEFGIAGLGDGAAKDVEDARVLPRARKLAKLVVELVRVCLGELRDGGDFEQPEVFEHGFADARKIAQFPGFVHRASII